jgi:hypothetical protein
MQTTELIKYIHNPELLDEKSVTDLQKLVIDFPYFQTAHFLLSVASKKWDASVYQQSLKKTAIIATSRAHLFDLLHREENSQQSAVSDQQSAVSSRQEALSSQQSPVYSEQEVVTDKKEEIKQELDILKAAEIASEPLIPQKTEEEKNREASRQTPEEVLEKEIGKQLVEAFVEKEILKTPEVHKPNVPQDQPESFGDWLTFLKKNNGQDYHQIEEKVSQEKVKRKTVKEKEEETDSAEEKPKISRRQKNKAIIDKIIESNPGHIRNKEDQKFYTPDSKAKESLLENEHLVTETLARIYALQGSVNKAVRAYEILSLKFPQKSAYFASLIKKLKNQ